MLFLDFALRGESREADARAGDARGKAASLDARVAELERRADRLVLACQALWELLREKTDLPEETVFAKMQEIDLRDGREDGKIRGRALPCGGCQRPLRSQRRTCVYCGRANPHKIVAD